MVKNGPFVSYQLPEVLSRFPPGDQIKDPHPLLPSEAYLLESFPQSIIQSPAQGGVWDLPMGP